MTTNMRELLEMKLRGEPLPPVDDQNARRVYCPDCLDEGFIYTFHQLTVDAARRLVAEERPLSELSVHYTQLTACHCSRGDRWHSRDVKGGGVRTLMGRYNANVHCRLRISTKNSEDLATLAEWIDRHDPVQVRAAGCENYSDSLAQWNNADLGF